MKVQVLADFLVEYIWSEETPNEGPVEQLDAKLTWIMYVDDASNFYESGVGLTLTNLKGVVTEYALHFSFKAMNN